DQFLLNFAGKTPLPDFPLVIAQDLAARIRRYAIELSLLGNNFKSSRKLSVLDLKVDVGGPHFHAPPYIACVRLASCASQCVRATAARSVCPGIIIGETLPAIRQVESAVDDNLTLRQRVAFKLCIHTAIKL